MDKKKEQELRMKTVVYDMDNGNGKCADCNRESMDYASINNGTIICEECAEKHKKLGNGISYLRAFNERWDDYLLNYIRTGGNSRFTHFAKAYHISSMDILLKYKTRASEYYREIIRSEVMGYDPPDNINLNTASEVLEVIENNYPEFENYTFVKHVDLDALEKNIKKEEESKGFFGSVTGFFGSVTKQLDTIANKVADLSVSEAVFEHGSKALDGLKNITVNAKKNIEGVIGNIVGDNEEAEIQDEEGKVEIDVDEKQPENEENIEKQENLKETEENKQESNEKIKKEEDNKEEIVQEVPTTEKIDKEEKKEESTEVKNKEVIEEKKEEIEKKEEVKEKVEPTSATEPEKKDEQSLEEEDEFTKKIKEIEKNTE